MQTAGDLGGHPASPMVTDGTLEVQPTGFVSLVTGAASGAR